MQVKVRLFGVLREALGAQTLALQLSPPATLDNLRARLAAEYPQFAALSPKLRCSINMEIVRGNPPLNDGDEVAFLPPVSGGAAAAAARCFLSDAPLQPAAVSALVEGPDCGGVVTFCGAVRNRSRGRDILHLEYEAYAGMAERELEKICAEAAAQWPGARVAVAHRVGRLEIGALAVVVAAAAPHRAEAFAACSFAINTLKRRVPIWKKEVSTTGESWVEETP